MPATSLRCRNCGTERDLDPVGACAACWGPLEPVYDLDELRPTFTRDTIAAGPPSLWRYGALLPVVTPAEQRLAPAKRSMSAHPARRQELQNLVCRGRFQRK